MRERVDAHCGGGVAMVDCRSQGNTKAGSLDQEVQSCQHAEASKDHEHTMVGSVLTPRSTEPRIASGSGIDRIVDPSR